MLSVKAVATDAAVSEKTVRRWIGDGKLRAVKIGRDFRVEPAALAQLKAASATEPAQPTPRRSSTRCVDHLALYGA